MAKYCQIGDEMVPYMASYKGGTAISPAGTAVYLTPPTGANSFSCRPAGGAAYYNLGGGSPSASSPGYIPENYIDMVGMIDNFPGSVGFWQASGTVYVQWFDAL